ncbi:ATP-dependent RNA helicase DRS1 [Echria macrotheca]|uniref:ATP-dependent RNA helicase DRS1 n=1 Tax=Echria macrotheca TaxID=438768 RepID=A0AAJ0BFG1_9PEZI|nr:ATP-dependent RNA helicase DRS1 [Echria macrotheca]
MAPSQKRKNVDDDFVFTIPDEADVPVPAEEETIAAAPPKKKARTASAAPDGGNKKKRKNKSKSSGEDDEENGEEEEGLGIWGQNDEDDGAMDSEFEFVAEGMNAVDMTEDLDAWGFDGAKGVKGGDKKGVDIDEIIRRRREKKEGKTAANGLQDEKEVEDGGMEVDLDEEVLADDAFGMGVGSDVDEEDEEEGDEDMPDREEGDEDEAASDDDSVATPVEHPADQDSGSDDEEEDAEEEARRKDFFAPEVEDKSGKNGGPSSFQAMALSRPILRGLASVGFTKPTPIQAKTIPISLEGKDVVGGAVTGSGKTAAFVVPILERLLYRPKKVPTTRVVILTPTRELAIQCHAVATKLASHTDIKFCLAVGGLSLKVQEAELRLRPDVVIATPGRFIDHMRNSASFATDTVEILVLDEADRMLEDGFADELNEILTTLPKSRQTMLFSATMTSTVDKLIRVGLNKPVRIMVDSKKKTVTTLAQEFVRLRPGREEKRMGYLVHICKTLYHDRVIIFFRQKKIAHRARIIFGLLGLSCAELHGSMNQAQRIASVEAFRDGKVSYLLATDLASRGLDIKGVDTVINYEAPQSLEIYVHRVGRTARAGRTGTAITLAAEPDRKVVKAAVRAGKAQGAKIISRVIDAADADKWQDQVDEWEDEIEAIMREEKEEKQLAQVEMQVKKGENLIRYEDEISSRPKRTWFETEKDKKLAKEAGRAQLNGVRDKLKQKNDGKLSGKDLKILDSKAERAEGRAWKKGRAERDGKGAVLNVKKIKPKSKSKPKVKRPAAKKGGRRKRAADKLAPRFGRFSPPRPHHRSSLLRYLFPSSLRQRYRERLLNFHLETLPHYKRRLQSRIYRFLVDRQTKRRDQQPRLVDLVRRHSRRLLLGPEPAQNKGTPRPGDARATAKSKMSSRFTYGYGYGTGTGAATGAGAAGNAIPPREPGTRRKKLAAMAGSVYRAGVAAASEIKDQYNNTRIRGVEVADQVSIPGAFPDVSIIHKGEEQMVLFPSYAMRHVKQQPKSSEEAAREQHSAAQMAMDEEEYWRHEWARMEDEKAIVDVDVRGWIYMPSKGPMTRRNRMLVGLARRLSGIPAPTTQSDQPASTHEEHERQREERRIAKEAREIERRGQGEKEVANRGGYSEAPRDDEDSDVEGAGGMRRARSGTQTPISAPTSPNLGPRSSFAPPSEMSEADLAVANANLMARIGPFMTTPMVELPITLFFYNENKSQSRTVTTNDSGHFYVRAALDFVPTHVRVLANENISSVEPIQIIEPKGISLISDIDDTIKRSNISLGAREIFRNTFIRDLGDLTIEGVREWYHTLFDMGVKIHYCSNSPWQLFPVLATYFLTAGLPPGSIHLKHYRGMLQGIFEPVAERKKGTLERILRDFPERKFLLVGDSGEADLEVYTELAIANPGRILAVFIRDVTTPEPTGYFDTSFGANVPQRRREDTRIRFEGVGPSDDDPSKRPSLPPRVRSEPSNSGPVMGTLIDLSEEPEQLGSRDNVSNVDLLSRKPPPPPRPAKPASLRSAPSDVGRPSHSKTMENGTDRDSPLSNASRSTPPPPPPPRRRGTPSMRSMTSDMGDIEPLPGAAFPLSTAAETASEPISKKLDLWRRRLARAHEVLEEHKVQLYTWRKGDDVIREAEGIVKEAMREM